MPTPTSRPNRSMDQAGALSLLPPLIAIVLAIAFKRVLVPLALAVLCGAAILQGWDGNLLGFAGGTVTKTYEFIRDSVASYDHLRALGFSLLFGAMVGVLESGGGMLALVSLLSTRVKSRRGVQMLVTALGLGIFFDDYANALLVGGTMRTTADRFGVSRAKLAYLVDTTSAPVAGLSPISTWVITEMTYVATGLAAASLHDISAFALLMASIPYRFYPLLALAFAGLIAFTNRDFGPMRQEETDAIERARRESASATQMEIESKSTASLLLALAAVTTVSGCIITVLASLAMSGWSPDPTGTRTYFATIGTIVREGDSYAALIHGGAAGLVIALVMHSIAGGGRIGQLFGGAMTGAMHMLPAMMILWLAWALSAQTDASQLNTGGYLAGLLSDHVPAVLLPTAVFLLASGVAFSTGTSWGTMSILTPISMQLALDVCNGAPYHPVAIATLGSVLAGSIFGDHCSPISDTTVLSSRASGCDLMIHVRTQMPYALSVGVISILLGTIPAALGVSPYLCLAMGVAAMITLIFWRGQPNPES